MIDHVGFPVSDYARSKAFYAADCKTIDRQLPHSEKER